MEVCESDRNTENSHLNIMSVGNASQNSLDDNNNNNKQEPLLKIGDHYFVLRNDNTWYSAKIIQIRPNEQNVDKYEYYVHYHGYDHRLDEWVNRNRIDVTSHPTNIKGYNLRSVYRDMPGRTFPMNQKRELSEINHVQQTYSAPAIFEEEHETTTKVKYIDRIQFGKWEIDTWYFSPYPDEYGMQSKLYICEYCLKYMRLFKTASKHKVECTARHPPGKEIYRKGTLSVFEIDGKEKKLYCQCLCLLAKLFLEDKAVFFHVDPFLFYVLTECDRYGAHIIGYFSKVKDSLEGNNLSCICILPPYQKRGFGKFLIAFSYELSKKEHTVGSPEKPLSDLGKVSYKSYWSWAILQTLKDHGGKLSIEEISQKTSITSYDIISTCKSLNMIQYYRRKPYISATPELVDALLNSKLCQRPRIKVDVSCLRWAPPRK